MLRVPKRQREQKHPPGSEKVVDVLEKAIGVLKMFDRLEGNCNIKRAFPTELFRVSAKKLNVWGSVVQLGIAKVLKLVIILKSFALLTDVFAALAGDIQRAQNRVRVKLPLPILQRSQLLKGSRSLLDQTGEE